MIERPILFSAPMVCAILAGRKTQTRRVAKIPWLPGANPDAWGTFPFQNGGNFVMARSDELSAPFQCRYGVPGDRLWVRETFAIADRPEGMTIYAAAYTDENRPLIRWKPSIHMPRARSRLTLEITDVRVERLQELSEADAIAEGIYLHSHHGMFSANHRTLDCAGRDARESYGKLWDSINGAGSWAANPWVWALSFRRIDAP